MTKYEKYAQNLLAKHGDKDALRIADNSFRISKVHGAALTNFDEIDFFVNDYGKYEHSKVQSNKSLTRKQKRIKNSVNFWALIVQILIKGTKNVK